MKKPLENYAFIDSQNLYLEIKKLGWKLDFRKFRIYLTEKYSIEKAYLFLGYLPKNKALYSLLKKLGYILIFKPILISKEGKIKGNVDAELVLHAMIQFANYKKALIVTGDGDFYCLVDFLKKQEKLLKLLIPNYLKYSGLFKLIAQDKIDFMNDLKNKLRYKNERQLHKDGTL